MNPLYSKGKKGEIRFWQVWTEGAEIYTKHGVVDGKMQVSRKTAKGKNIGKKNETTPSEQALLRAQSMWNKQVDKGYFETVEEAQTTEVFLPMKAEKFDEKKHKLQYPCVIQPKLNGVRCIGYWHNNEVRLMSRGGKTYNIKHISEACKELLGAQQVFDGEIYIHGESLQKINSLVKKPQEESIRLEYRIYDTFWRDHKDLPFDKRLENLEELYQNPDFEDTPLKKVPWGLISDEKYVRKAEAYWVERGYEGAIVRDLRGTYEIGKRSNYLLKVKSFMDEEFSIVGFKDGEGAFEGCVIWECITKEGKTFSVTPKGSMEQRAEWFRNGNDYIGEKLTVKFFEWSDEKKPLLPVGLAIRLREDM
jgi:ATP-dependent DNA ligase